MREFSVDDGAAQCALGWVVGRFDAGVGGEGPQRGPDLAQVVGEAAVVAGALALAGGFLEQLFEFVLDLIQIGLQACAVVVLMLVGAPRAKHAAGERETVFAEALLFGEPFAVAAKVALQMRPTDLAPVRVEMFVAGPAV